MTLTRFERALFSNVSDQVQRLADTESLELIKKFLKLDGLVQCLRQGATEEPDLIDDLFDQLRDDLASGRAEKERRNAMKRRLAFEKKERQQREASKKRKRDRDSPSEERESVNISREISLPEGLDIVAGDANQQLAGPSDTCAASGVRGSEEMSDLSVARQGAREPRSASTIASESSVAPENPTEETSVETRPDNRHAPFDTRSRSSSTASVGSGTGSPKSVAENAPSRTKTFTLPVTSPAREITSTTVGLRAIEPTPSPEDSIHSDVELPNHAVTQVVRETMSSDTEHTEHADVPTNASSVEEPLLDVPQLPSVPQKETTNITTGSKTSGRQEVQEVQETMSCDTEHTEHGDVPTNTLPVEEPISDIPQLQSVTGEETPNITDGSKPSGRQEVPSTSKGRAEIQELVNEILKQVWPKFAGPKKSDEKRDKEMEEIMTTIERLNFWTIQYRLLIFAEKRIRSPSQVAKVSKLADDSDPVTVFHAIEAISAREYDAKLLRVYSQVRLVKAVRDKISKGFTPNEAQLRRGTTTKTEYPKFYLAEMAEDMTDGEPKNIRDRTLEKLRREYRAGKKWMDIIEDFNGEGIVFIILFASE
ncbi:MAG: hypothetical protein Q9216_005447 [Gyalolechia sp. 2 TL-2023]